MTVRPTRLLRLLLAAGAATLVGPGVALADTTTSSNWSGYAVHRTGVSFRAVSATWRQPSATCVPGQPSYSAMWVGLGGFSIGSPALEQIGTEVDCSASGAVISSAWYELVPAPSADVRMTVRPGDLMHASVTVTGHRVMLALSDLTRRRSFSKTVTVAAIDVTSAEWILEAPSECFASNQCRTLTLADFGSGHFADASAQSSAGSRGTISSRLWGSTMITLASSGRTFAVYGTAGAARPTALQHAGAVFQVNYAQTAFYPGPPLFSARASAAAAGSVQPGGARG
jgi:hypothetical protein